MKNHIYLIASFVIFGTIGGVADSIRLSPMSIAALRGLIGGLVLLPFAAVRLRKSSSPIRWADLANLLIRGLALALNWILLFAAFKTTSVAIAATIYYTAPLFLIVLNFVFRKEPITLRQRTAVLLSFLGVVIISAFGKEGFAAGDGAGVSYALGAATCYATLTFLNQTPAGLDSVSSTAFQLFFSFGLVLLGQGVFEGGIPIDRVLHDAGPILVLGVVHTGLGFLLFFHGLSRVEKQTAAVYSFLDPLTAIGVSFFFLHQSLTGFQLAGVLLVLLGITVGSLKAKAGME